MYQRAVVAILFLSSTLMPPQALAQSRIINKEQKKPASQSTTKKRNSPIKRNADLDGPFSVQPGANPDGKGGLTIVSPGSGAPAAAGTAAAASTGGSTAMASTGSNSRGIPVTVTRATGENGSLILGYTPQASPSPTPAASDNSGLMMAAAGLAAVFAALAGGGKKGKEQPRSAASNVGSASSGATPAGSTEAGPETRTPSPAASVSPSVPAAKKSDTPIDKPASDEPAVKGDKLTATPDKATPTPKPEKVTTAADDRPPSKPASEVCNYPGTKPARNNSADEFLLPHDQDAGTDFEVVVCNRHPEAPGKEERVGVPMTEKELWVNGPIRKNANENRLYTRMTTNKPEAIFPPMQGEVTQFQCNGRRCVIHIKHPKCPTGAKAPTCTSIFRDMIMTDDQITTFKKRSNAQEGSAEKQVYPCEPIGTSFHDASLDWYDKDSKMFKNSSHYAIFGNMPNGTEEAVVPLVNFKGWKKVADFSMQRAKTVYDTTAQCLRQAQREKKIQDLPVIELPGAPAKPAPELESIR